MKKDDGHRNHGRRGKPVTSKAERFQSAVVAGPEGETKAGERRAPDGTAYDGEGQNFAIAISPNPAANDTKERSSGMKRPNSTNGSP